jgi:hypothetical protein
MTRHDRQRLSRLETAAGLDTTHFQIFGVGEQIPRGTDGSVDIETIEQWLADGRAKRRGGVIMVGRLELTTAEWLARCAPPVSPATLN